MCNTEHREPTRPEDCEALEGAQCDKACTEDGRHTRGGQCQPRHHSPHIRGGGITEGALDTCPAAEVGVAGRGEVRLSGHGVGGEDSREGVELEKT